MVLRISGAFAWLPIVFIGLAAPAGAQSADRRVLILNASTDPAAGMRAVKMVRQQLTTAAGLVPLASGDLARAFEAPLPQETPEERAVAAAEALIAEAENLFDAQFKPKAARRQLLRAETALLQVRPSEPVLKTLARGRFLAALIHLREQNRGLAVSAFQLARTVDPSLVSLDAGQFKPDAVAAFREAVARGKRKPTATVTVSATYDVPIYIDGVERGRSPVTVELQPGLHCIAAVSPEHRIAARVVDLVHDEAVSERLELLPLNVDEQARRLRAELRDSDATDARAALAALIQAARRASRLAQVDAAVVVTGGEGARPRAAIYDLTTDRLSYFRPADSKTHRMFGLLLPVPAPRLPDLRPDLFARPPPGPTPWWQRPLGIAGLVSGGVAMAVIGVLALTPDGPPSDRTVLLGSPQP